MKIGVPGEFHEERWQRTEEDSERRVIPRTPEARDAVVGGMESELVPTEPSQTYPAAATIGKSRNLRNEAGRKHKRGRPEAQRGRQKGNFS